MADKELRFTIDADADDASRTLEDVADAAEQIEKLDPTVQVDADAGDATAELGRLERNVKDFPTLKRQGG